jgi:site-specific DNA-methyltransferase (adenine-specific)
VIVITVARKPLSTGTVATNVLEHGCGAININASRINGGPSSGGAISGASAFGQGSGWNAHQNRTDRSMADGRWPANLILSVHVAAHLDESLPPRPCTGPKAEAKRKWFGANTGGDDSVRHSRYWAPPSDDEGGGPSRFFKQVGGKK